MSMLETINLYLPPILRALIFIVLYVVVGAGPGFIIGLLLANRFFGEGPIYMDDHRAKIKLAIEHNAQWHPKNERWKKK